MNAQGIRDWLSQGRLLFDGATGTYAQSSKNWPDEPVECACLHAPDLVQALHEAYIGAGSMAIKTNTFAAHVGLAAQDEAQQRELVAAAMRIARQAAGEDVAVFADIGPAPAGEDAEKAYMRLAELFINQGADCYLFETMSSISGVEKTAAMIRSRRADAFIAVSFAADPDGFTRDGESAAELIARMDACPYIDAVGLNCVCGAYHMERLLRDIPQPKKHLIAMPNAGYPHIVNGRTYYDSDPAYYAQHVAACAARGAAIVGGCCGTRPEHIRQIAFRLGEEKRAFRPGQAKDEVGGKACASRIKRKLDSGKRVILVELDPPRDSGIGAFLDGAKALSLAGADAVTIADCPIGRARMDSSLLACKIHRELGVEALPHMTCRDRNVNATKALLLGLSMEGVHNVLAVTGDPVPTSDRGSVKSVFQFNSRVMARFVHNLGVAGETEPFFLCGALNINAVNFDMELERARDKEACGMQAFLTQPVLSERAALNLEQARSVLKGRLIGGLFPVVSHKNALFLNSEVAGIALDERIIRAYKGLDREQGEELAVRLCSDAAKRIAPFVEGFYIMTPFQRVELVCRVMQAIRGV